MAKKITIYGVQPDQMANDIAKAIDIQLGSIPGIRVVVEDMNQEEETERMRSIMLAGPNEIFGRNGAPSAIDEKTAEEELEEAWINNGRDIPPEEFMPVDLDDEREMRR